MCSESKVRSLFSDISYLEDVYNQIVKENKIRLTGSLNPTMIEVDIYTIKDKKVVDTIIKYYGNKINKLKNELKKELDKKL